jgi:PAS domain S-box-containing protein
MKRSDMTKSELIAELERLESQIGENRESSTSGANQHLMPQAMDVAQLGGWEIDVDRRIMKLTSVVSSLLDIPETDSLELDSALSFWEQAAQPEIRELLRDCMENGAPFRYRHRLTTAKGNRRWIDIIGVANREDGKIVSVSGTFQDVTHAVETELQLKEQKQELDLFFNQSMDGIFFMNSEEPVDWDNASSPAEKDRLAERALDTFVVTRANRAMATQYGGQQADEIIGRTLGDFFGDDHDAGRETIKDLFNRRTASHHTKEESLDGRFTVWIEGDYICRYDEQGRIAGLFGVQRDVTERVKALQALRESERRLSLALSGADLGTWDWNLRTGEVTFDRNWAGMIGYEVDELRPHVDTWHELVHPDDLEWVEQELQAHLNGESESYETEHRVRHKDGHYRWVLDKGRVVERDENGAPTRASGTHLEITKRKEAELELERSETMFRGLFQNAGAGIAFADDHGTIMMVNDMFCEMLGYTREEAIGKNFAHFTHEEDLPQELEYYKEILAGKRESYSLRKRYVRKDGSLFWVSLSVGTLRDAEGNVRNFIGSVTNIDDRVAAEEELKKREALYSTLVNTSPDGLTLFDTKGRITWWSERQREIFGVKENDSSGIGTHATDWIIPEQHQLAKERMGSTFTAKRGYLPSRYTMLRTDGSTFVGEVNSAPLLDDQGNITGMLAITRDVTEQVKAEEDRAKFEDGLRHTQKLESLGVLAGGIAHDFNNLLVGILGNAELAMLELSETNPAFDSLNDIAQAATRASDLSRQMLAYSGKGRFIIEAIDLSELVHEMAHMLQVSVSKNAILKYDLSESLPATKVDSTQIRQVAMNLITNASDAIGDRSGIICVRTGAMHCDADYLADTYLNEKLEEGDYVYLEVEDTGAGMDRETLDKIFDPFFTTKFTGRGLGLAAVLGIVRGHKGAIRVSSSTGKGTSFRVLLPASDADVSKQRAPENMKKTETANGRILLVDDEDTVRTVGRRMLEKFGYEVVEASDGRQALDYLGKSNDKVDCILLDLMMPHMGGEEAFRALTKNHPDTPVLITSGYSEQEIEDRFSGRVLSGFIQKPFRIAVLRDKVGRAIAGSE